MHVTRRMCSALSLGLATAVLASGCGKGSSHEPDLTVTERLASSLHVTTHGIEYWYESAQGGFETLTGVPYEALECGSCHVETGACESCHGTEQGGTRAETALPAQSDADCYGCHGNQYAEAMIQGLSDYHRDALGLMCTDCHHADEVHGDGTSYNSLHDPGAIKARCENSGCHQGLESNEFHDAHAGAQHSGADMECAACHVQSVVTCYNCHFEYEVQGYGKLAFGQFKNWRFLLRRDRGDGNPKIDVGNLLTATYQGKAFVAVAPYFAHSISKNAIGSCEDCHDNEYVREYNQTGKIVVASWDEGAGGLVPNIKGSGVIPIPPDWRTSLEFGFATFDEGGPEPPGWVELKPSEVGMQMLFAEPLEALPGPR
jgi:predicted CXXCH cytochrome family protein